MESLRAAKLAGIRTLVVLLSATGAAVRALLVFLKKRSPGQVLRDLRSRSVLWPWFTHSTKLVLGTLAYNTFVFVFVEPILRRWFPPLKPWEHVQGVFGSTRTTYEDIVPAVATVLWIAGNALVITLLNRRLQVARHVE